MKQTLTRNDFGVIDVRVDAFAAPDADGFGTNVCIAQKDMDGKQQVIVACGREQIFAFVMAVNDMFIDLLRTEQDQPRQIKH